MATRTRIMESWNIKGHTLEYIDEMHQYLIDGMCVPSITQLMKLRFQNKYKGIDESILKRASEKGTELHEAIEKLCKYGEITELEEVYNFIDLQEKNEFKVIDNEIPIILFENNKPVGAGRLDLVLKINEELGLADIKRTYKLDKEYLEYQLNLYRLGYQQSYDKEIKFLKGIHLRNDISKFVDIPINEEIVKQLIKEWKENE